MLSHNCNCSCVQKTTFQSAASADINIQIVYTLLEKGADLYIKNKEGFAPVDMIIDPNLKKTIET